MKKSFTIQDLPISERPRERLLRLGTEALSSQEILALILGRGIAGESVIVTSQRLLTEFGNLKKIANASVEELTKVRGIGIAKAAQVKAAFELAKRVDTYPEETQTISIGKPEEIVKLVKGKLKDKKKEYFLVVLLNSRKQLIRIAEVSIGSIDTNIVHPREVFKEAISGNASFVILVHNHPSGNPLPSEKDISLTKRLVKAGKLMGIEVLDHVIIAGEKYSSIPFR